MASMRRGLIGWVVAIVCVAAGYTALEAAAVQQTPPAASPPKPAPKPPEESKSTFGKPVWPGVKTGYEPVAGPQFTYDFYGMSTDDSRCILRHDAKVAATVYYVAGKRDIVMDGMAEDRMWARMNSIEGNRAHEAKLKKAAKSRQSKSKDKPAEKALPPRKGDARMADESAARETARTKEMDFARDLLKRNELGIIELFLWDGVNKVWQVGVWNDGLRTVVHDVQPGDFVTFDEWGVMTWYSAGGVDQLVREWPIGNGVKKVAKPAEFAPPNVATAPWWVRRDNRPTAITVEREQDYEEVRAALVYGFESDIAAVELTAIHGKPTRDRAGNLKSDVLLDGLKRPLIFQRARSSVWGHLAVERKFPNPIKYEIGARFAYTNDPRGAFVAPMMQLAPGLNLEVLTMPKSTTPLD